MLTCSQRLGPVDAATIAYSVNVLAGKKIRFNVRDSVNPGFEGSAFTDALDIGEFLATGLLGDKSNVSGAGTDDACLATGPIGTGGIPPYVYHLLDVS